MKKTFRLTIVLLLLLSLILPAYATEVDMDYNGELNSFSGQPLDAIGGEGGAEQVVVSDSSYYNQVSNMFVYKASNDAEILSSVADGMVTTEPVKFDVPAGIATELFRNGQTVDQADLSNISEPGNYVLSIKNSAQATQSVRFTIVNATTGALNEYVMPEGFVVKSVLRDGQSVNATTRRVDLQEEGVYTIVYACQATGMSYQLDIAVDHTAPTLALEAVKNDVAKGPVDISDLEEGATVLIQLNGDTINYRDKLTQSGSYVVTVQDQAGNKTTYKFVIQVYLNISSLAFFAVATVVVVGVTVYLIRKRKHLRVR